VLDDLMMNNGKSQSLSETRGDFTATGRHFARAPSADFAHESKPVADRN